MIQLSKKLLRAVWLQRTKQNCRFYARNYARFVKAVLRDGRIVKVGISFYEPLEFI